MKVSIIIPVYNAEDYIEECLKSALNQTYKDIEIIAINDGSKDDSLSKLEKFSEYIKIISKNNGGTASALNTGIKAQTGEWFKWLSADDALHANAIEELISEAKITNSPENCIFYSNYHIINSNSKIIGEFIESNYNGLSTFDINTRLLDGYIGNGTTCLIHKSAFDKCGLFDQTLEFGEDYEFWLRLCVLNGYRLHLIPKFLAKYRHHNTQLTSIINAQKKDCFKKQNQLIIKKILSQLPFKQRRAYKSALQNLKQLKKIKKSSNTKQKKTLSALVRKYLKKLN